jgi:hypothetical protein
MNPTMKGLSGYLIEPLGFDFVDVSSSESEPMVGVRSYQRERSLHHE